MKINKMVHLKKVKIQVVGYRQGRETDNRGKRQLPFQYMGPAKSKVIGFQFYY